MTDTTYANRILLLVTGLSPQVVTETVYALAVKQQPAWVPTEVHVLTTVEGRERAGKELLDRGNGWFSRLCKDYDLPAIRFDETTLHLVHDDAKAALNDIRTEADSQAVGNALAGHIARFTAQPDSQLHVSIAGGRKTMGFLAGYALSLLGRAQDRLSHVLVSEGFESLPKFFYPTPYSKIIHTNSPENRPLDTREADVSLADIPFVRLRAYLGASVAQKETEYAQLVNAAQTALGKPCLDIDLDNHRLRAGGQLLKLPMAQFALYAWLATRHHEKLDAIDCPPEGYPDKTLGTDFANRAGHLLRASELSLIEGEGLSHEQFTQWKSRLHSSLRKQLGQAATPYLIEKTDNGYGLHKLEPDQIHFTEIAE